MQQTIREAGYRPIEDNVGMTVSGRIEKQGDNLILDPNGMQDQVRFRLTPAAGNPDIAIRLETLSGETCELEGGWTPPRGGTPLPTLWVTTTRKIETGGRALW